MTFSMSFPFYLRTNEDVHLCNFLSTMRPLMAGQTEKSRSLILLLAPPVAAMLMWLAWSTDFATELENITIDWRFKARADNDPKPSPKIALVGIGENSLKELGRWEEWKRDIHGRFLQTLAYRPPKVIAFDFFFTEPSEDPEVDFFFADSLALHPGAITGMFVDTSNEAKELAQKKPFPDITLYATKPFPNVTGDVDKLLSGPTALTPLMAFAQSSWTGSVNSPTSEVDGMRRRIPLITEVQGKIYPSFVLQILMQIGDVRVEEVTVEIGNIITIPKEDGDEWKIPIDDSGFLYLNYRDTNRFQVSEYEAVYKLIESAEKGDIDWPSELPPFTDQVVIIGQSATGLSDFGPTPYRGQEALIKVQATALDSILRNDFIRQIPKGQVLLIWLAIAWLTLLLLRQAHITLAILIPSVIILSGIFLAFFLFDQYSFLVPLVLPAVGFALIHTTVIADRLAAEFREKRAITGMFQSYVAPALVKQMVKNREMPELGGEEKNITILFSDIQGFSAFSEELTPVELVDLMVEYLSEMTDIVTDSGGTLDKYIGDAIDAMFGAPLPLENHTYIGVMTSIQMQRMQEELCKRWVKQQRSKRIQEMRTRIGLNVGPAVVGNIGSQHRFNYTTMGDSVNLGARMESGAKTYGVCTMITGDTYEAARATKDDITYRHLDRIVVKGRTIPVQVYEVIEQNDLVSSDTSRCLELYENALEKYFAQEWDSAREVFQNAAESEPFQPGRDHAIVTNPSRMMAARCEIMKENPPGDDWDGAYEMTTK
jgi:adenylate cyclase